MAAKSLINLFRVANPMLLRAKDRGRPEPKNREENDDASEVPGNEIEEDEEREHASESVADDETSEETDGQVQCSPCLSFLIVV